MLPLLGEGAGDAADQFHAQLGERYEQRRHDIERPLLPPAELYLTPQAPRDRLNARKRIEVCAAPHARHADAEPLHAPAAPDLPLAATDAQPAAAPQTFTRTDKRRVQKERF